MGKVVDSENWKHDYIYLFTPKTILQAIAWQKSMTLIDFKVYASHSNLCYIGQSNFNQKIKCQVLNQVQSINEPVFKTYASVMVVALYESRQVTLTRSESWSELIWIKHLSNITECYTSPTEFNSNF